MHLPSYLPEFEAYLKASAWPSGYPTLYEPCDYIMQIGGKRVRPVSVLMAYHVFQDNYKQMMPAALAIEVFHNFTLMHDDIMDQAALRRNKATVHTKYDTNTAILSGDVMLIHAYDLLIGVCDKKSYASVLQTFSDVARGVCEGQRMDMDFETTPVVDLKTYIQMISLKTAVLLAGSLKIGALLAGAKKRDAQLLYQFGLDAGIAFQILDDYLDAFANQADFGKTVGGDIIQGKKTYLVISALAKLKGKDKKEFAQLIENTTMPATEKVESVTALLKELGVDQMAKSAAQKYSTQAEQALAKVAAPTERKQALTNLLHELLGRKS